MKKTTLLCVMAILCLFTNVKAQDDDHNKIYVNQRMPDMLLGQFIRYKTNTANLSDFGGRLIIFAFWFRSCGSCIKMFPTEDSLQRQFNDRIQIIPVTFERQKEVEPFLTAWEKRTGHKLSLPYIVEDTVLTKAFNNIYHPYYVWVAPNGRVLCKTSQQLLHSSFIRSMLELLDNDPRKLKQPLNPKN